MSKIIIMDNDEYKEYEVVSRKKRKFITVKDILYMLVISILITIMYFNHKHIRDSIITGLFIYENKVYRIIPY